MSDIAIKVENLSKLFQIGKSRNGNLRETLSSLFHFGTHIESTDYWALKDVSFEIKKGEAVGIIGKNGAGKSTLLKILSRITQPTNGRIEINGRVSSLLEVGTGFHPELTGKENVFLNGTILGMKRVEIKAKFDEIVAFSGVEKFINTPVKHYSSGMYVRLAFAVAAHLEPEILIVDEVLAVGDAEFQKRCLGKMEDVSKNEGRTILFVSHNMQAINVLCQNGLLLEEGKLEASGSIKSVINRYNSVFYKISTEWNGCEGEENVKLLKTWVKPLKDGYFTDNPIEVGMRIEVLKTFSNFVVGFHLLSEHDDILAYVVHDDYKNHHEEVIKPGIYNKIFTIPANTLAKGGYYIRIDLGIHNVKKISNGSGDLRFSLINRDNLGCRFPVLDVKGFCSLMRPNWSNETLDQ